MATDPLDKLKNLGLNIEEQDCKKIICMDESDVLKKYQRKVHKKTEAEERKTERHQCPLTRERMGRYSWGILHTFAAYYPINPTVQEQQSMFGFLNGFKTLYPCTHCKSHFSKSFDKDPPNLSSQKEVSIWLCKQHNTVNKMLGKNQFNCEINQLNRRWMTGCQDQEKGF